MSKTEEKSDITQEKQAPHAEENEENAEFRAKKHLAGAATWFVCAVIIVPCYFVTKIWAMAAIIPFLLILAAGYLKDGLQTRIILSKDSIEIKNAAGFGSIESRIKPGDVKAIRVASSKEQKEETIHSLELLLSDKKVLLPDLDHKVEFLNRLKRIIPKAKIEKVT